MHELYLCFTGTIPFDTYEHDTLSSFSSSHKLFFRGGGFHSTMQLSDQGPTDLPSSPMLAVGAYSTTNANGDLAVYNKDGAGYLYKASHVRHLPGTNTPAAWLYSGQRQPIDNGGATLTSEAIPISAQNIAFILDQVSRTIKCRNNCEEGESIPYLSFCLYSSNAIISGPDCSSVISRIFRCHKLQT